VTDIYKKTKHEQFFGSRLSHCVRNYLNKRTFFEDDDDKKNISLVPFLKLYVTE